MKDHEFVSWMADRMVNVYGESPNVDFVRRAREVATNIEQQAREIERLQGVRDQLRLQASIQAQEARTQKAIVSEIGAMVGESNDWLVASAVSAALRAQQPPASCTCVYATSKNTPSVRKGFEVGGYLKEQCAACAQQPAFERPSVLKQCDVRYSADPLACSGCVSGCFRCRTETVEAGGVDERAALVKMEQDLDAVALCGCRIVHSNKNGNILVQCQQHSRAALTASAQSVQDGFRVMKPTSAVVFEGDRWEIYAPCGSGGIVSEHDVTDWVVRKLLDALAASPAPGIERAAKYLEDKASDYAEEFGSYDPDTGSTEFRCAQREEYFNGLHEQAEELRALLNQAGGE